MKNAASFFFGFMEGGGTFLAVVIILYVIFA